MQNILSLSDLELLSSIKKMALEERKTTLAVLRHLREVERRMLFARVGFQSLYDYARTELGYSEGAAHRRIASMRLLKELPELEIKVQSGTLPLSTLVQAHSFFRSEKIKGAQSKREVIAELENKSHREVQKTLLNRASEPHKLVPETLRPISQSHHKMSLLIDEEMLNDLEELRGLLASSRPGVSLQAVVGYALKKALEAKRMRPPKSKAIPPSIETPRHAPRPTIQPAPTPTPTPALELVSSQVAETKPILRAQSSSRSRYVPLEVRRQVWARDKGSCTYTDPSTDRMCGSQTGLQLDHIKDFASGGETTTQNLRLRCRSHNLLVAIDRFGVQKMSRYLNCLR